MRALAWVGALVVLAAAAGADVRVISVQAAEDRGAVLFSLELERPGDMERMDIERSGWEFRRADGEGWRLPRVATLSGDPVWAGRAYLRFRWHERWAQASEMERLRFVGLAEGAGQIELTLRYPAQGGDWATGRVRVDLDAALEAGNGPTRTELAQAEAGWFRLMGRLSRDWGGFYSYAELRTRELANLDVPAERRRAAWRRVDRGLYELATGSAAVQESLQLERMLGEDLARGERTVRIDGIEGIPVRSHPFDEMRGGAEPADEPLARAVPEDNWYARFDSVAKLLDALDFADEWGGSVLHLAAATGTDYGTRERTMRQLCFPPEGLTRLLGPTVVDAVAVTGSDPFLRMGSDITVILRTRRAEAVLAALEPQIAAAVAAGAERSTLHTPATEVQRVADPTRAVSLHIARAGGMVICGNSYAGVLRVLEALDGRRARLADAGDFRYIRAVEYRLGAQGEDGFIYLSDAFIRRVTGPEVRIKQARRLEASASLRMMANAALLHGYWHGPGEPTLEELITSGALDFDRLYDPEGGTFSWDAGAMRGRSDVWGHIGFMTPLVEVEAELATEAEAAAYGQFRRFYQGFWREYFDPIAARVKMGKTVRAQVHILPLIETTAYNRLREFTAGEPVATDLAQFGDGTLLGLVFRLGDGRTRRDMSAWMGTMFGAEAGADWMGDWVSVRLQDSSALASALREAYGIGDGRETGFFDIFGATIVLGMPVKSRTGLAAFLVGIRSMIQMTAPGLVEYRTLEPYKGVTIVQIAPDPGGEIAQEIRREQQQLGRAPAEPSISYATIGGVFYVSTQADALRGLIDLNEPGDPAAPPEPRGREAAGGEGGGDVVRHNTMVYFAPGARPEARPTVELVLAEQARRESLANLSQVWMLGRCGALEGRGAAEASRALLGYRIVCPLGGSYAFSGGDAVSDRLGPLHGRAELEELPEGAPLRGLVDSLERVVAALRFTEHGVETEVRIERNK